MIARRNLLLGLGAFVAAPAVIRTPGLLMPVRPLPPVEPEDWIRFRLFDGTWGEKQALGRRGRNRVCSPPVGWMSGEIQYRVGVRAPIRGPVMVYSSRRKVYV